MGSILWRGAVFVGTLGELTGYKSGLALTEDRFREIFAAAEWDGLWPPDPDLELRMRSEHFTEIFAFILGSLGIAPTTDAVFNPIHFVHDQLEHNPELMATLEELESTLDDFIQALSDDASTDPEPFITAARSSYGDQGVRLAKMITEWTAVSHLQDPWNGWRSVDWSDVRDLDELFRSEKLGGPHGEYFDERFANFLAASFNEIDEINWRQLEGLAAEFFKRDGYEVELGPGRNDGGVDIRLRPSDGPPDNPPTILVQCKRERRKISKTVVKALWADLLAEHVESGVIVTTSSFSPGAAAVRTARGYPIVEADRDRVREFIEALRTPGTGVYLAE
jgi:restriction system protein